jgi:hypothetical protein
VHQLDEKFLSALEADPDAYNGCYRYSRVVHSSGRIEILGEVPTGKSSAT